MQANTSNNRNEKQSEYITRKIYRNGKETIIVERVQKPQRIGGFEI